MNRWLMKSIVDLAAYLSLEAPIPLDMASDYLDILESNLEHLTASERAEFTGYIEELKAGESMDKERIYLLEHLAEKIGIMEPKVQWYFVRHLSSNDPDFTTEQQFEIQVLDARWRGKLTGYASAEDTELTIGYHVVPGPVIAAVKRMPAGYGDFVNVEGERARSLPSDLPGPAG